MPHQDRLGASAAQYQELVARYQSLIGKYQEAAEGYTLRTRLADVLLQHTPDGVALVREGRVVSANRPFHALCTLHPQWRRQASGSEDERSSLQSVVLTAAKELLEEGTSRTRFRIRPSQSAHPILEVSAIRVEKGRAPQVALILKDLTEEERRDEELRGSERRDEFLATLAHELRNPLTPIVGAAEYLRQNSTDPETRHFAEIILRQARHQSHMIEDLLDIARVREGKLQLNLEPVDLREVVRDAVEATEARRQHGPRLVLSLPEDPVWVQGDSTRLVQVVANLLSNAAKFTPATGVNSLELASGEGIAWLRVRDSGAGIPVELLPRVWQTFVQGNASPDQSSGGGLGIGLSLVKSLTELHGGGVRAASEGTGRGAEFTLWLPLGTATALAAAPPAAESSVFRRRLLIVEDNADARETLQELFSAHGHEVAAAGSFAEAVDLALKVRPEAVLCDLRLPDRDGMAVATSLRPLLPKTTFIAMSGDLSPEVRERARAAGFDNCLQKPLESEGLLRALHAA